MTTEPDRYYLKTREVRSRYYGHPSTFEAWIVRRRFEGAAVWSTVGRSKGHTTREAAQAAGLRLADRRDWKVETDPRLVRRDEFTDRYGDD